MTNPIRLLIVDDSALYRQTINNVVRELDGVEVVGVAKDGVDAIEKIEAIDPDLLTLDVQMPDMDGIGVLREINRRELRPTAIMVSSLTTEGAQVTTDALLEGAFDFILKPTGGELTENRQRLLEALAEKIGAFRESRRPRRRRVTKPAEGETDEVIPTGARCRAVILGTSTGGPAALKSVLPHLPADFSVPILIVQHMPAQYTASLARRLDESCPLAVAEAGDGVVVESGRVLVAPGGQQMRVAKRGGDIRVRVTDAPPEHGCRPSVDHLVRSVVDVYDGEALCVIMTGMGRDGTAGCGLLKSRGGTVFAQHEDGCTVFGMPKAVIDEGHADKVVPLDRIARAVVRHVAQSPQVSPGSHAS